MLVELVIDTLRNERMDKTKHSTTTKPLEINETNLSKAWAEILVHTIDYPGTEISPLILSLSGFNDDESISEDEQLRSALDNLLESYGKTSVENVAFTIFPECYWRIAGKDRKRLFEIYSDAFPRIQAFNKRQNYRGLYFQRMIKYGRGPCDGNQLEWIISQYHERKGMRRSMFQATIFDAEKDHTNTAQLGFPCLQHVSFVPAASGLVVNAFYATQKIFDKAYGNYLGLIQLGHFMAKEFDMPLERLNVMVGVAKLGNITKSDMENSPIMEQARKLV